MDFDTIFFFFEIINFDERRRISPPLYTYRFYQESCYYNDASVLRYVRIVGDNGDYWRLRTSTRRALISSSRKFRKKISRSTANLRSGGGREISIHSGGGLTAAGFPGPRKFVYVRVRNVAGRFRTLFSETVGFRVARARPSARVFSETKLGNVSGRDRDERARSLPRPLLSTGRRHAGLRSVYSGENFVGTAVGIFDIFAVADRGGSSERFPVGRMAYHSSVCERITACACRVRK